MDRTELSNRTKLMAIRALNLVDALPNTASARAIANQLARCATSVGANYRAAGRARSRKEFAAKLGIVEEESDETCFWLELIIERGMVKPTQVRPLLEEAREIVAIIVASRKTVRSNAAREVERPSKIADRRSKIED